MSVLYVTSIAQHGSCDTYLQSLDLVTTQPHNCLGMAWALYLCISELILDIFVGICWLTPDPGSIMREWMWLYSNLCNGYHWTCVNWNAFYATRLYPGVVEWINGVRILSENCHSWNLWEYRAIKFALTLEWHVWQKSLGCYMTEPNNRDQQNNL